MDDEAPKATPDFQARAERLALDNVRLRSGIAAIQQRSNDLPHVVMPNGISLHDYCRALLIGPSPQ